MKALVPILFLALAPLPSLASDMGPVSKKPKAVRAKKEVAKKRAYSVDELCQRLQKEAKSIDALLHKVTDKASAEQAAQELQERMDRMNRQLKQLEELPSDPSTAQTIATQMAALTHITQGFMPTIQRLIEVNAYGSDSLLGILHRYRASQEGGASDEGEDLPQSRLYEEMGDSLGDALYILRKTQDTATAKAAASSVRDALSGIRNVKASLETLGPATAEDQQETVRMARERLQALKDELRRETDRLREAGFYYDPDLPLLLQELIELAN